MAQDCFNYHGMRTKSEAAAYFCAWIVAVVKYNSIYKKVKPLEDSAHAAEAVVNQKNQELTIVIEKVK